MKTIEEAAKENALNQRLTPMQTFKNGVKLAQKWMPIKELPPHEEIDYLGEFSIDILLKNTEVVTTGYYDFYLQSFQTYGNGYKNGTFTHWRPIEIL